MTHPQCVSKALRTRTAPLGMLLLAMLALLGCRNTLVVDEAPCGSDFDCAEGEACVEGACSLAGQSVACEGDLDCNTNAGEVCDLASGACVVPEGATGCMNTSECPMDQYCNSTTRSCAALQDGWCRQADHCGTAEAPRCSAASPGVPGRCVQCLSDADCGGGTCVQPGLCEGGAANPGQSGDCPANSVDVNGQCQCNPGFAPSPTGEGCVQVGDDSPCPPNASEASPGQCVCNPGFEPSADLSGCVAVGMGEPEPSPDPDPGSGGGGGGFDLCATFGWYDDGLCDDFCPQPDPDCDAPQSSPDPGTEPEPTDPGTSPQCFNDEECWDIDIDTMCGNDGTCVCDLTWMESQCGSQGVDADTCSCGTGGANPTNGLTLNASCVVGGQVLECNAGLECIWAGDGDGMPAYGSCKQVCASSLECPGSQTCALGFLGNGDGICGTPLTDGQTGCGFWDEGNTFCFDPSAEVQDGAFLECINSTCDLVCDSTVNTGASLTCPVSQSCGNFRPAEGFSADIATCN